MDQKAAKPESKKEAPQNEGRKEASRSSEMQQLPQTLAKNGRAVVATYLTPTDTLVHTRTSDGHSVFVVCPKHFSFSAARAVTLSEAEKPELSIPLAGDDVEYGLDGNRYREIVVRNAPLRRIVAQAARLRACLGKFGLVVFYNTWVVFATAHEMSLYSGGGWVDDAVYYAAVPVLGVQTYLAQAAEFESTLGGILCGGVDAYVRTLSDFISSIGAHIGHLRRAEEGVDAMRRKLRSMRAAQKHLVDTLVEKKKAAASVRDVGARTAAANMVSGLIAEIAALESKSVKLDAELRAAALVLDRVCYENIMFVKNAKNNA